MKMMVLMGCYRSGGFGRVHQNIFFLFENVLNFFLKYFGENRVF